MDEKRKTTKIQHFVPQFFQRYFSFNNNGKTIGMFNVNNGVFIKSTEIKTQLYEDYLYGKSGQLEVWLSKLENKSAPIFREMLENETLPRYQSNQHHEMLNFLIVLDLRNPIRFNSLKSFEELIKNTKSKIRNENIPTHLVETFKYLSTERGKTASLTNVVKIIPEMIDLKYKLIKNISNRPFIISDNPLIIYNQLLEKRKSHILNQRGYGQKGLQMLLPINEKYMLVVYDANIYKVGNRNDKVVLIDNVLSIDQLNILQFLNSSETICFNHRASEHYIKTLFDKSKSFKKANEIYINVRHINDRKSKIKPDVEVVELGITDLKINLVIQKITFTSSSVAVKINSISDQYRKGVYLSKDEIIENISISKN